MKKGMICTVASAMVLATMPAVEPLIVSAKTLPMMNLQPEKIEIKTAQDFINAFCSIRKVDEKGKLTDEYLLITEVTDKNYSGILLGLPVYETFKEEMKLEINTLLELQQKEAARLEKEQEKYPLADSKIGVPKYTNYEELVEAAKEMDKKLFPEKYDPNFVPAPQPEKEDVLAPTPNENKDEIKPLPEENKEEQNSTEVNPDENKVEGNTDEQKDPSSTEGASQENDLSKEESKPEDSNPSENQNEEVGSTDTSEKEEPKEEIKPVETPSTSVYPTVVPTEPKNETPDKAEEEVAEVLSPITMLAFEQPAVPAVQEKVEVVQEQPKVESNAVETGTELKVETKISSKAKAFVDAYLRGSNGQIYTQANNLNYKTILNGLSSWNKLTSAQKKEVNTTLKKQSGKTYQTLLKEAQRIQLNGVVTNAPSSQKVPNRVNTATENQAGFYGMLMGASIALAGFFTRMKRESEKRS